MTHRRGTVADDDDVHWTGREIKGCRIDEAAFRDAFQDIAPFGDTGVLAEQQTRTLVQQGAHPAGEGIVGGQPNTRLCVLGPAVYNEVREPHPPVEPGSEPTVQES